MKNSVLVGAVLLLGSLSAVGQSAQPSAESVCEVNLVKAKPGASKQLEQGRKAHNNFHVAQKDKHPIEVWQIATGPNTGDYMMITCGLAWKDMDGQDAFDAKDTADIDRTMTPYVQSTVTSYYVMRTDLGGVDTNSTPKMLSVTTFHLKGDGAVPFTAAVKKVNDAIAKTNYPSKPSRWYQLANGGEGPQFVLVGVRNSWADMEAPQKTLTSMLEDVYGKDDTTLQTLRGAVRYNVSELLQYRSDLSYVPAK